MYRLSNTQKEVVLQWQRFFHQNPEISFNEVKTSEKITEILNHYGIENHRVGQSTGISAEITGELPSDSPKRIMLRADIDALPMEEQNDLPWKSQNPGAAHTCGHDGHTAALLGAAVLLNDDRASFSGSVRLIFQPAEESVGGASIMIREGELDGVDLVAGIHFWPALESGKIACEYGAAMAGCEHFCIRFFGKGGHISVPHLANNPILSASETFIQLQTAAAQQFSPFEELLIGVGKIIGGTQYNIIPEEALLEGTIRAFQPETLQKVRQVVRNTAEHIGAANNNTCDISFGNGIPPVMNDPKAVDLAIQAASALIGKENVMTEIPKQFTGDDFSFYAVEKPAAYIKIGSWDPSRPETNHPLHSPRFNLDEKALYLAAEYFANYACAFLRNPAEESI